MRNGTRLSIGVLALGVCLCGCPSDKDDDPTPTDEGGATEADTGADVSADVTDEPETTEQGDPGTDNTGEELPEPTCANYCALVQASCGDEGSETAQYASEAACLDYCETWAQLPAGDKGDTAENSIGCRIYHADVAGGGEDVAAIHCPHAGASGGDTCGTLCESYCHLAQLNCTGDSAIYDDLPECKITCAAFPSDGEEGATAGDSVQCRIYHLGVAGSDLENGSAATHCPHGATDGGGVCGEPLPEDPTCDAYCAAVQAACTGDNAQYAGLDDCKTYCAENAKLPIGEAGDIAGNTVGCRTYHAGVAAESAGNAVMHCPHAGPSGGNVCGSWCDNYCHLSAENCTDDNVLFPGGGDCMATCEAYALDGAPGDTSGDSVQCRIYHLGVAGTGGDAPGIHCPHGALDGGGVCVDTLPDPTCEAYCSVVQASCTGDNAQYPSEADCLSYCSVSGALKPGTSADTEGNTIGCRIYHATVAGDTDPELHCAHAGPSGGDVCGSWCTVYCDLATQNCTGDDAIYPADDCLLECPAITKAGSPGDTEGDSIQCRIYHLGVAGGDKEGGSAGVHCPHGALDGGGVCVPPPTCAEYCTTIQAACTGENEQYKSEALCLEYCASWAAFPEGTFADTDGNTIGCRIYHAGVASTTEPAVHCAHAGPSGGGVCGTWCENYCGLADKNCTGEDALFEPGACEAACEGYPAGDAAGATEGDSVQCRIYHLGVAGSNPPDSAKTHCPHGAVDGGGVCIEPPPTCEEYCAAITTACTGDNAQYTDEAACVAYCNTGAKLPPGTSADTAGNTIGCRAYHAGVAATTDPALHCAHAGPSGGGVCGSWCENYCYLGEQNCGGELAQYTDNAQCMAACGGFVDDAAAGAVSGDSVQCRIYHLGVAGSDVAGGSADLHCPHGDIDGGGVCENAAPSCSVYCGAVTAACSGPNAQYADQAACMTYCSVWALWEESAKTKGKYSDTSGVTVGCRIYHARVAAKTQAYTHCPHAGPTGAGGCGSVCQNYCDLEDVNCDSLYPNSDECTVACALMNKGGSVGATTGDSVQCRIYHLGVAGSDFPTSATLHCPHGAKDGGGVCVGEVPVTGDTCESAFAVGALPYSAVQTTAGAAADYAFGSGDCPGETGGYGAGSADQVYVFTPETAGTYQITLTAEYDSALYVVTDCGAIGTSCAGADDELGAGKKESLNLALEAGTTYYVIVDGWHNSADKSGAYTLTIAEPCTPACDGKTCGDDGCGGSCGTCDAGSTCTAGVCAEDAAIPGNTCDNPFAVGALPFSGDGDTGKATNNYTFTGSCAAVNGPLGSASSDQMWSFSPAEDGTYEIVVTPAADFDPVVSVLTDCAEPTSCQVASDVIGSGKAEALEVTLTAGSTVLIIVDGFKNGGNEAGPYSLAVALKTEPPPPGDPTYEKDVQPLYAKYCTPCHSGSKDNACSGGSCFVDFYSALAFPSYTGACATAGAADKGACGIVRIKDGSMPQGKGCSGDPVADAGKPGCMTADEQDLIQAWVDAGAPEK